MTNNKIDLFVTNILFVMVLFVPLALLSGPFVPDLIVSLITLIFLIYTFALKEWKYYRNRYFLFFIIFCIYILLRSIFSSDPLLSLESSLFYFRFGIFSLAVWFLLDKKKNFIRYFSIALLIAFIFAIFDGYYQYFFEYNLFGFNGEGVRISLPLNDSMVLGNYLARLFPFFLALYFFQSQLSKYQLLVLGSLFILIDVLIFSTGERTALLLLFISTIFILLFISKYRLLRSLTLIISVFILAFIASFDEGIKSRNIDQTINQLGINQDKLIFFSHRHESHFNSAFLMFKENPLLGVGPKLFRKYCDKEIYKIDKWSCTTHPHNNYIQILAETGIIGFIMFLMPLFLIMNMIFSHIYQKIFFGKLKLSDYQICIIATFIITLWPLAPNQNFFNNWISIIYYLPIGFFLHSLYENNKN